jgi:GT2 family glycosyltransferase
MTMKYKQKKEITASGLFDATFYANQYPDTRTTAKTALSHYMRFGMVEGRQPSAFFNPGLYLKLNPDVAAAGEIPILHYIRHGHADGRPLPDERAVLAAEIKASNLFDPDFYLARYPDIASAGLDPLDHFVLHGMQEGRQPSAVFDPALYLKLNPDVAAAGEIPILHYIRHGRADGRPLPDERAVLAAEIKASNLFDPDFYSALYLDVANTGLDPLEHFLQYGAREGRRPSIEFNNKAYLEINPDVAASGQDPLTHYLAHGRAERRALPSELDRAALWAARDKISASGLFDPAYYVGRNPVLRDRAVDPILHYIVEGAADYLDPSRDFSALSYVAQHLDIAKQLKNPLLHYLCEGIPFDDALPRPEKLHDGAATRTQDQAAILAHMAANAYVARYGFSFDPSGPTRYVSDAVVELAVAQPADLAISDMPDVSIIIPIYGQMPFVVGCLDSLCHHRSRYSVEIVVADDASPLEHRTRLLEAVPWIRYRRNPENLGFLDNCNAAAAVARGRYIVLLNSDIRVLEGWLDELIGSFDIFPRAGLVGSKLLNGDGTLQEAGGVYWSDGTAWNYGRGGDSSDPRYCFARQVDWVSGASIALPTAIWSEVGGFDTLFRPAYCEDVDLAFRIRQRGYEVWYQPLSCLLHFEGMTHGRDETKGTKAYQVVNLKKLQQRWRDKLPGSRSGGSEPDREACRSRTATMLVLDAVLPTPDRDAGSVIAVQILLAFRELGFHLTFAAVDGFHFDPFYARSLQRHGIEVLHSPFQKSVSEIFIGHRTNYDYVLNVRYNVAVRSIKLIRSEMPNARILFLNADLHFLRMEREAALKDLRELRIAAARAQTEELGVFAQVDSSLVHTPVEREEVLKRLPSRLENILVLPWVSEVYPSENNMSHRRDVMFLGGFPHTPNVDAVDFFVKEVWPRLVDYLPADSCFLAVGNAPPNSIKALASDRVTVTGRVPTVEPYFARTRVFVAPLRYGAGIKGKVIQSLANGVPTVASTIAVEGIGLRDGEHCLIADTPEDIAKAVLRLYNEPETWLRLREAGHQFVENNYSWPAAVQICKQALDVADATWMRREAKRRDIMLRTTMDIDAS